MIKRIFAILITILWFVQANVVFAYYNPGTPQGYVNDYTSTLTTTQVAELNSKLTEFEKSTTNELAVVIIQSLQGDTIENFSSELFADWGIGKKGADNGALILVALDDRKMRVEVGYGLEPILTDAQSSWVVNKIMKPAFKDNDFYEGIDQATNNIIAATNGEVLPEFDDTTSEDTGGAFEFFWWLGIFGFMWLSSILGRSKSWWLGGVIGGFVGIVVGLLLGFFYWGILAVVILTPLGLLFDFVVSQGYQKGKSQGRVPWWAGGGNGRGGGFGGFGGGMSGGGGSSGSW